MLLFPAAVLLSGSLPRTQQENSARREACVSLAPHRAGS